MSHCLAVVGLEPLKAGAFERSEAAFKSLTQRPFADTVFLSWCTYAVCSKEFGEPQQIFRDAHTGATVALIGSWLTAFGTGPSAAMRILARCQTEPLGQVVRDIDGAFALLFSDPRTQTLAVATDLVGSQHIFTAAFPGGIAICTSARVLASAVCAGGAAFDPVAVQEFWATGNIYEDRSLWQGVRKLGPACILTVDGSGKSKQSTYWSFAEVDGRSLSCREAGAQVGQALGEVMARIAKAYPNPLADVTGGYDSRVTISGFVQKGIAFSGTVSGPADSPDVLVSKQICDALKVPHFHVQPKLEHSKASLMDALALTDGEFDLFEYSNIAAIHRTHASRGFSTSINGSFGELARGYWWELLFPRLGRMQMLDAHQLSAKRFAAAYYDKEAINASVRLDLVAHLQDAIARSNAPFLNKPNTTQMDHAYVDLRMQRWQGRIGSSTAHIWPSFTPFMFHSILMPTLNAKPIARWRSLLVRHVLATTTPQLANLALEHGYPATTAKLTNLHRFWPVVGHYLHRVKSKFLPQAAPVTPVRDDAALLEDLGLTQLSDWALASSPIFSSQWLQAHIEHIAKRGVNQASKRLITLELALKSVTPIP